MAVKFSNGASCYFDNADWMDNATQFSWAGWVRFDAIDTNSLQFIWCHRGATDRMEVYKRKTNPQYIRFQVYAGGVGQFVDDTTGAPAAGTLYHIACTWQYNTTGGMKIYRNGVFVAQSNTTTQTLKYNSGGSVDLYLASNSFMNPGLCTLENLSFWPLALTAEQVRILYWSGWHFHARTYRPNAVWPLYEAPVTRFQDISGNSRHIPQAQIVGTVTGAGALGHWDAPTWATGTWDRQTAGGPPPPNTWTLWDTVSHPTVNSTVTGLTNSTTYQFAVAAVDTSGNESQLSSIVEATPSPVLIRHTPRRIFRGH